MNSTKTTIWQKIRLLVPECIAGNLGRLAIVLFILAIPTFLVTSNVRMAFDSLDLYRYGFERYDVVSTTGLDMGQLMTVAQEFVDYFNSSQELLDTRVAIGGEQRDLFNKGEVLHMRDVKGMVLAVHRLQVVTGAYILGYAVVLLLAGKLRRARALAGRVIWGSLLTMGLLGFGGLASLIGFDQLFDQFHSLGFTSGTYTFDPQYNYLTRLFTEGFFMDTTLFIVVSVIVMALLLVLVSWGIRRFF
jgi:integral membrane protein (TIGR01906 family)